jgi:hypothetical protein
MSSAHDLSGLAGAEFGVRLAVIKDIAQAMRDPQSSDDVIQAAVDSPPVRGTTFRLYLPVHEETTSGSEVVVERSATS